MIYENHKVKVKQHFVPGPQKTGKKIIPRDYDLTESKVGRRP
ncbi:MAG: hypothetical protein ACK56F_10730 [bacterium]